MMRLELKNLRFHKENITILPIQTCPYASVKKSLSSELESHHYHWKNINC